MAEQGVERTLDSNKIVIGFTGRLDSVVAAYLLKKQGFEVMAVAALFYPREKEEGLNVFDEDMEDHDEFYCVNRIDDLNTIKDVATKMGLGFYAVDASAEYKALVSDALIASRVAGVCFTPEYHAHTLLLNILVQKADLLGAKYVATGHFAKMSLAHGKSPVRILSSNDLTNDQCDLLARVKKDVLKRLKLPLADMRKQEVKKVADTLGVSILPEKKNWNDIVASPSFNTFVSKRIPLSMIKSGQMIDYMPDGYIGDHSGIHQFYIGAQGLKVEGALIDQELVVADIRYKAGLVLFLREEHFSCERIVVSSFTLNGSEDISNFVSVYLKRAGSQEKIKGTLIVRNNSYAEFVFDKPQQELYSRGESVVFLSHNKEGARIFGSGDIIIAGMMTNDGIERMPARDEDDEEEEVEVKNNDFVL